jgi:hypothetical protein
MALTDGAKLANENSAITSSLKVPAMVRSGYLLAPRLSSFTIDRQSWLT